MKGEYSMNEEIIGRGWIFPPRINAHGGIALTNDRNEIDQAIIVILSTVPGSRVMRPEFGCQLDQLVFAPNNSQTCAQAKRLVKAALDRWEPRIRVRNIDVRTHPDDGSQLLIEILYETKATRDPRSLVFPFYLIPEE
jgi:uncharacterized protein